MHISKKTCTEFRRHRGGGEHPEPWSSFCVSLWVCLPTPRLIAPYRELEPLTQLYPHSCIYCIKTASSPAQPKQDIEALSRIKLENQLLYIPWSSPDIIYQLFVCICLFNVLYEPRISLLKFSFQFTQIILIFFKVSLDGYINTWNEKCKNTGFWFMKLDEIFGEIA